MPELTSTVIPPSDVIGGCRLLHQIGQGGMGVVFLAEHRALQRKVAIKLLPESRVDRDHVRRFLQEARACARIEHPNVVPIYNVGVDQGHYFIEMKYVDGRNLAQIVRIQGGPLPWRMALKILRHAAKGVEAVHNTGLIHRDIKPSNIMISGEQVFLMDFGLVREETHSELTQPGTIVGTPAFMSPEQCLGEDIDRRTDVYSLGATLYFLLTGRLPHEDSTPNALLARVASGKPPLPIRQLNPTVPQAAADLVGRAMAFDRGNRYQTAGDLLREMTRLLRQDPIVEASTVDTSRMSLQETRLTELVPELVPLQAIPSTLLGEGTPRWKLWAGLAGGGIALLALGIVLNLTFGAGRQATPETSSPSPASRGAGDPEDGAPPPRRPRNIDQMVRIPAGNAHLGDELPRLAAHLPDVPFPADWPRPQLIHVGEFLIDKHETTNAEYAEFVQATGHRRPSHWSGPKPPPAIENHPVTHVSYEDASAFATWAGKQLPTEAQWIRAFRGDRQWFYPWGDTFEKLRANVSENGAFPVPPGTSAVTASPADVSEFGVYNLVGNAAEIVRDKPIIRGQPWFLVKGSDWARRGDLYGIASAPFLFDTEATLESRQHEHGQYGFRCVVEQPISR
ncbi:MAG TPA: bifunctional serine/threonine-protein kinase/formylglycine-generating enzyme family protein [Planctomycetaceae bacterium]|nr:bifunctional serine/threonine-protein kinase/formylglycine-generating enzyme family protein [Planctomycetaceae bacterium]